MANRAAWIVSEKANPLKVDDAPTQKPEAGTIVIKNHAAAVNPIDWKIQNYEYSAYTKTYPFILGTDVSGTVEEVGEGVTRFQKGDRVISHVPSLLTSNPIHSGYQLYPHAYASLSADIPDSLSFEQAVVLPLAISTAAAGLYLPDYLSLPLPTLTNNSKPTHDAKKSILIWGGSSSVGATAIQLAVASGLRVVTTASESNYEFVKSLGASLVFNYRAESVVENIVNRLSQGESELVGVYDAISEEGSIAPLAEILERLGKKDLRVAGVLPYKEARGLDARFVFALHLAMPEHEQIGKAIWEDFVPGALVNGQLQAKPDPVVVGKGLESVQHALDVQMKGVSARKVVVDLQ
ncbi:zinc-binding alcohol dehydrogenase family protein [Aspergillus glaucus CBS 516.65]|uniref:Enoyl reductase (ER) domain-containing protein n=1 Tax=Aspergillus glaucus CBS 516.65 TaxID=1160497 RepID=A0A1L9VG73_ASPGL|nr:hypothetical protein ASPGLDRAFT_37018 [Aspergillus glaucus CBS 516.65]OJJ82909.1 hypothetical protein ASPGLDRAFT_37018 [Aspergillus glaucus CBS 516.65]